MGFLTNFFTNVYEETDAPTLPSSSFDQVSESQLEAHLGVSRYGSFELTDAVRPSYNLEVVPSAGFRHDIYHDEESHADVPVLMAAASRERVMETFMELLGPLGPTVDVVLETSHGHNGGEHTDLYREHIDMPILQSILWDFEDLLVNDGCTGVAVLNPRVPQEVQLDEHKLMIVYGSDLRPYEGVLIDNYVDCREEMKFITEAEHVHSTTDEYIQQFEELKMRLGMDGNV
ncbi:MAG: hypothetical protein AAGF31_06385 [Planctomycetota bacterium]